MKFWNCLQIFPYVLWSLNFLLFLTDNLSAIQLKFYGLCNIYIYSFSSCMLLICEDWCFVLRIDYMILSLPFGHAVPGMYFLAPKSTTPTKIFDEEDWLQNLSSPQENFTCRLGKLKTEFTSLTAKYTCPRLSDTTFFMLNWMWHIKTNDN